MSRRQIPHDATGVIGEFPAIGILQAAGATVPTDGTAGYAPGCIFHHIDGSSGDAVYVNDGTAASCDFNAVPTGGSAGAADVGIADAGGFTTATTVEAALAELYQHLLSTQVVVPISLGTWREVDSSGDVGAIAVASGNGGNLASDTTPILRGGTNESFELAWEAGNADIVSCGITLPADIDDTADAYVDLYVQADTTDNAPSFSVLSSWQAGSQVTDTATAVTSTAVQTITATIASGDVPAGATFLTLQLVPAAHATSVTILHGARLRYKGKLRTS
jgi:hypothetical protein